MPTNPDRIIISGLGLISPLGLNAWQTFTALLAGRTLADRAQRLPAQTSPVNLVRAIGCVNNCRQTMVDPTIEIAERVAREATTDASVDLRHLPCYLGTSKGAVHSLTATLNNLANRPAQISVAMDTALPVALGPHGYLDQHLHHRLGLDIRQHVVSACASSLHALHNARLALLDTKRTKAPSQALVLTAESAMLPLFIHSYLRLGVLAPPTVKDYLALPLDERRTGFMLAEMGAAVVMERTNRIAPGQIELIDTALASESHDLIRPSPNMHALAHVAEQLVSRHGVDVLHPHAPGTIDHDPVEMNVYSKLISDFHFRELTGKTSAVLASQTNPKIRNLTDSNATQAVKNPHISSPKIYACKGATGHGLGAAGLVSLVIACLCAKTNRLPPMPWLSHPIDCPLPLSPAASNLPPNSTHGLFAAGFAGHVAGAVIRQHPARNRALAN